MWLKKEVQKNKKKLEIKEENFKCELEKICSKNGYNKAVAVSEIILKYSTKWSDYQKINL